MPTTNSIIKEMTAYELQKEMDQCFDRRVNLKQLMRRLGYKNKFAFWRVMAESGLKIVFDEITQKSIVIEVPKKIVRRKKEERKEKN